ncbi:MAG: hypothetical protein U1E63_01075 [Burkholderiales bacterium]
MATLAGFGISSPGGATRAEVGALRPAHQGALARQGLIIALFLAVTVFSRFGINLGSYPLSFSLFIAYGLVIIALASGNLAISPSRLLVYCSGVVIGIVSLVVNTSFAPADRSSATSLLLLMVIYLPLVFVLWPTANQEQELRWTMRVFSNIAFFCGIAGIAQFFAQFVIHADWLFDFTPYIPTALQQGGIYNTVIPVGSLYKSNGFFFREPSGASFVMALALLVEMSFFHRPLRMVTFALALVVTYSGTGLLALMIGFLFSVRPQTVGRLTLVAIVGGLCAWAASDVLNLSFTLNRIHEFTEERSSAYIRYVAPMRLVNDILFDHPWSFWIGFGPGTISRLSQTDYEFHDPTWAKLLVEYGILGFAAFLTLITACIRRRALPLQVQAVLFFSWLVMGGHLLTPDAVYLVVVLGGIVGAASLAGSTAKPDVGEAPTNNQGVAWDIPR